ncbi:ANTAR domain-containing protein [Streptomyces sp. NPDC101237]|uniref:ANTAR domain-containing protein n=1 Tax=Streptomyces sp. NPDC101237 TaxID=3366139 RepID=UPI00380B3580
MAFFAISASQPLVLRSSTDLTRENERLAVECGQLHQAVTSHALVDQAIGAIVAMGRMPPEEAWRALRDVSQRTNTKMRTVAENILAFAQGTELPEAERDELRRAINRYGTAPARDDTRRHTRLKAKR